MKTREQIELAQEAIKELQDYVELAKVAKKLKGKENIVVISRLVETITETIVETAKNL